MKKLFCCPALELFHCLPPLFCFLPLWKTVRLHGKKLQNATNLYRKESMYEKKDRLKYNSAGTIYYDWIHSSQRSAMYVPLKRGNKTAQDWDKKHAVDDAF